MSRLAAQTPSRSLRHPVDWMRKLAQELRLALALRFFHKLESERQLFFSPSN
jgi:hypothetical protein